MGRKRILGLALAVVMVSAGLSNVVFGAVHRVPEDYTSIQGAIDAAADGDTVLVADGIYTGEGNRDIDFKGKAITVCSENGPKNCIIDCNGTNSDYHRGFYFHSGEYADSILEGITISNGYNKYGGGIYCNSSSPTISMCIIKNNIAVNWMDGGGIYCVMSNLILKNSIITNNEVDNKGGGLYFAWGKPTIVDCNVAGNTGIGVYGESYGDMQINRCNIKNNSMGGIVCFDAINPAILNSFIVNNGGCGIKRCNGPIRNCVISGNLKEGGFWECSGPITNCTITNNISNNMGGGLSRCTGPISNCLISGNTAMYGGGLDITISKSTITNCTIVNNKASTGGGGVYGWFDSNVIIKNSILWNNTARYGSQVFLDYDDSHRTCTLAFSYCDVEGEQNFFDIDPTCTLIWKTGNIKKKPFFVDPNEDFHLLAYSECINNGDPNGNYDGERDYYGSLRVNDGRVDMGAAEFGGEPIELSYLVITGPNMVTENSSIQYSTLGYFEDGFSDILINSVIWSVEPNDLATFDVNGLLTIKHIEEATTLTITAQYISHDIIFEATKILSITPLLNLEIVGPNHVIQNSHAHYKTLAYYDNGQITDVTRLVSWQVHPKEDGIIDSNGLLTIGSKGQVENFQINVTYTVMGKSLNAERFILLLPFHNLNVPAEYSTIQAAVNAAKDFDTVLVADGVYSGPGNRDIFLNNKSITIKSENGPENCVIDCNDPNGNHLGFNFNGTSQEQGWPSENINPLIEGFKIIKANRGAINGRGVNSTIKNCIIADSEIVPQDASPVTVYDGNLCVIDCEIVNNTCTGYGVIRSYGENSNLTMRDCVITGNTTIGGVIECSGNVDIGDCTISNNAGVAINYKDGDGILMVRDCVITGNNSYYAGGIYCNGGNLTVMNCVIKRNKAESGNGGGINCTAKAKITNCVIADNEGVYGGGIYFGYYSYDPTITNCTLVNNKATKGGAIYNSFSSRYKLTITNSIIWENIVWGDIVENNPAIYPVTSAKINYSDIEGGWQGIGKIGNIDADPIFIEGTDYKIQANSPCVDSGTRTDVIDDIEGNKRPLDGNNDLIFRTDMGAYEVQPSANPSIGLEPAEFSFRGFVNGTIEQQILKVRNAGGGSLEWQIEEDCPWLEVEPEAGVSIGETNEVTISVNITGLAAGVYDSNLIIVDGNSENFRTMPVKLIIGSILHVPSEYATIQAAIDEAGNYDLILAEDGVYAGVGNRGIDFKGNSLIAQNLW